MDVSVIIPNYNHGGFVGDAIQSVLDQDHDSYEIIVVDDGSSDNSLEVIARFGDRIRLISQKNQGLGAARNTGLRAASAEMVGLLDADDQWQPSFLKQMMELASSHPEAAVFYCCAQGMDSQGQDVPQVFGGRPAAAEPIYWTLLRSSFIIPSCVLMRRSILLTAGLFETNLRTIHGCEDWDLWLRLATKYQFVGTSKRLARYRLHADTFSANRAGMQRAVQAVIEKHFGPDIGCRQNWSREKQRAYGGAYRFHALSSVRQDDWRSAARHLRKAVEFDPTLALDRDFFYDIALGSQPAGYRGTPELLDLKTNVRYVKHLLVEAFLPPCSTNLEAARRNTYGTANLSLGLAAYNSGLLGMSRRSLLSALRYRPALWYDPLVLGNIGKSLMGRAMLRVLRRFRRWAQYANRYSGKTKANTAGLTPYRYGDE